MSFDKINTKCACGAGIGLKILTPKRFHRSVEKADCPACKSRYLFTSEVASGDGPIKYNIGVNVLEISELAQDIVKKLLEDEKAAV